MKTTIVKWGNSQGVRLPKHVLESAGISEEDSLELVADKNCITISKTSPKPFISIEERFQGFSGEYGEEIVDWGAPVGKELW